MFLVKVSLVLLLVGFGVLTILTGKFLKEKRLEEKLWQENIPAKINNPGVIKKLKVLPLIDYYTYDEGFEGEPGVSYLIIADDKKIVFDVGFNGKKEHPSPLLKNMEKLGVEIEDVDFIFISHLHRDHVGGTHNERKKTFSLSGTDFDLKGKKVYTPVSMTHPTAEIQVLDGPQKLSNGIVSIGPIHRALWLMGLTAEQSLAINVEGKGIVLIVGCGHQKIERIIKRTEDLFDIPIYGVIGGLHYPVTVSRLAYNIQRVFATGKPPWQRITKSEVKDSVNKIYEKRFGIIAISAHDSCDWTLGLFKETFGTKFLDIRVGKEIVI